MVRFFCIGMVCSLVENPCFCIFQGQVGTEGADAILEPCSFATAAGDGRELWQLYQKYALQAGCTLLQRTNNCGLPHAYFQQTNRMASFAGFLAVLIQAALIKWADCECWGQEMLGSRRRHSCADWLRQWKHMGNAGQRCTLMLVILVSWKFLAAGVQAN
jgi:hypothetical protein